MDAEFSYIYRKLTGKSAQDAAYSSDPGSVFNFIAGLLDDSHIILLHAILDEMNSAGAAVSSEISLDSAPRLLNSFQADLESIQRQIQVRLQEFRKIWISRYAYEEMCPIVQENGWIIEENGSFRFSGKGNRTDTEMLYKQFYKDMVTEALRVLSLFNGMLFRLQEKTSALWHRDTVSENQHRLLPLLEAAVRSREAELLKSIRENLTSRISDHFIANEGNWESLVFPSERELYLSLARHWYVRGEHKNGSEGFMLFISDFVWQMVRVISTLFHGKWRLFLRGLESSHGTAEAATGGASLLKPEVK